MGETGSGQEKLRRVRVKKKIDKRQRSVTLQRFWAEILLVMLFVLAVLFLLNPFDALIAGSGAGLLKELGTALVNPIISGVIAFGLLLLFVVGAFQRAGWRIRHSPSMWKTRCPQCGAKELRRTRRLWHHHLLGRLGLPVRRYICAECHWRGGRIDQSRL